jgi:hypothetical protein
MGAGTDFCRITPEISLQLTEPCGEPAIDDKGCRRDVAREIGKQEHDGVGYLFRLPSAPNHRALGLGLPIGCGVAELLGRFDNARRD